MLRSACAASCVNRSSETSVATITRSVAGRRIVIQQRQCARSRRLAAKLRQRLGRSDESHVFDVVALLGELPRQGSWRFGFHARLEVDREAGPAVPIASQVSQVGFHQIERGRQCPKRCRSAATPAAWCPGGAPRIPRFPLLHGRGRAKRRTTSADRRARCRQVSVYAPRLLRCGATKITCTKPLCIPDALAGKRRSRPETIALLVHNGSWGVV